MNNSENDTDNESYDSWNESEDEYEESDFMYEPEEPGFNKFTIVLCEKYNKRIHGTASKIMNTHYLTHTRFKQLNMCLISTLMRYSDSLNLEIAECIYLPSQHCVSIIKTFWLKIIQKKWKKIIKERKLCISKRCNPNALKYREIYGNWPADCNTFPILKGMLSSLSRTTSRTTCR